MEVRHYSDKYLLIARKRGFWASSACGLAFERRLLLRSKPTILEQIFVALAGLFYIFICRPETIILGTSTRIVPWYATLRRKGWMKNAKFITDCQYLPPKIAEQFDRIVVYSSGEIAQYPDILKNRFVFLPYPSKIEVVAPLKVSGEYIFCGGNNDRDHVSFIEAIRGLDVKVIIVTDQVLPAGLPANFKVFGHMPVDEYMGLVSGSLFVVVPLNASQLPHGHCDISSAFGLGKAVISTRDASVEDYIKDGVNGFLVQPGDVLGYRKVLGKLLNDRLLLAQLEANVRKEAVGLTYEAFAEKLKKI